MRFRPCIDIHNGKVKQIVGGSLKDYGDKARENFVSVQDAAFYAEMYKKRKISGGHVILLNAASSSYYKETKAQALKALKTYPGGLQAGGGINDENAEEFLNAGASHVIVTSFVFKDGQICWENLKKIKNAAGREHLVLDLSCRKSGDDYYIVTDRWQKFTKVAVCAEVLDELSDYCDEFLVHGVDSEGKSSGIEMQLADILAQHHKRKMTYAGGVSSFQDLEMLKTAGGNRIDVTIGSALDIFGGNMAFDEVVRFCQLTENLGK